MLKKLLKYDLQNMSRFLIIFYTLAFVFSLSTRIFLSFNNSFILNIIGEICSGITISMIFNILINNIIRIWVRFRQNLYGDEAYLTHTLPVSKKDIYKSKIVSLCITLFTSFLVIALVLFIAYYSKENMEVIKTILIPFSNMYEISALTLLLVLLFILCLEIINALQCGFTGIILGHGMNNNKIAYSIGFGFLSIIASQTVSLFIIFVYALFNKEFMQIFSSNNLIDIGLIKQLVCIAIIVYIIIIIVGYFINQHLLKKGVNVE